MLPSQPPPQAIYFNIGAINWASYQLKGATSLNMLRTRRLGCSLFRRNSLTGERLLLESNMCLLNEQMLGYSRSACGGNIAPGGKAVFAHDF